MEQGEFSSALAGGPVILRAGAEGDQSLQLLMVTRGGAR